MLLKLDIKIVGMSIRYIHYSNELPYTNVHLNEPVILFVIYINHSCVIRIRPSITSSSDSIARNQSQFRAVLQEHIAGRLLRIDANTVICDDGTRRWWHLELFGGKLEDRCKWGCLWYAESADARIDYVYIWFNCSVYGQQ